MDVLAKVDLSRTGMLAQDFNLTSGQHYDGTIVWTSELTLFN
jgi:hypothetical protein